MISIKGLTFKYQSSESSRPALKDVKLEIDVGEFVGITGAGGAGKTTLLRVLNGIVPHFYQGDYHGYVTIDQQDPLEQGCAELALSVGSVFQDPESQIVCLNVEEELAFAIENLGIEREEIKERIIMASKQVGITDLLYCSTEALSGGQKQKVAIACALAMMPKVLILDEPTSELDPFASRELFELLKMLNKQYNMTILVVSQKTELLSAYCPRLIIMKEGQIYKDGLVSEVFRDIKDIRNIGVALPPVIEFYHLLQKQNIMKVMPISVEQITQDSFNIEKQEVSSQQVESIHRPSRSAKKVVIQARNVHFEYEKNKPILRGVNLDIWQGEFVAITGKNGCGKTTFAKQLNGLLRPMVGEVLINGKQQKSMKISELAKQVGFLFQNPDHQIFCSTVREEIVFGLKNIGIREDEIDKRLLDVIDQIDIIQVLDHNPYLLPRAIRQRVALASIVAMQADILVLDEPTTGQDYREKIAMMDLIYQFNKMGKTIIMITHDMELVNAYASRMIIFKEGNIIKDGRPNELLREHEILEENSLVAPQLYKLCDKIEAFMDTSSVSSVEDIANRILG